MTSPTTFSRYLLLIFGVFCGSTAVIMIKAGSEHPFLVAAFRLLIAALALSPWFFRQLKQTPSYGWRAFGWAVVPGVLLAIHFMSWVVGARQTSVANASLITNFTPAALPFFVWLVFGERINRRELIGTVVALSGLLVLGGSNFRLSPAGFLGDLICFGSMLAFALYLALGRRNGARLGIWLYMVPLYTIAGLICLLCALPFINPIKPYAAREVLLIFGLGLIPTVFGHTILNYSLHFFRGQVVSISNLGQILFATLLGVLMFREAPPPIFYLAAALMLLGILIVLTRPASSPQPAMPIPVKRPNGPT